MYGSTAGSNGVTEENMKTFLMVVGIVLIAAAVLSLLFAAFSRYGYYHTLDGSHELYERLEARMKLFFVIGLVLAVLGAACLIVRTRL